MFENTINNFALYIWPNSYEWSLMVNKLQEILTNREIAAIIWISITIIVAIFTKIGRKFFKTIIPPLICRKFIIFYVVFLSYFCLAIYLLYLVGFWNRNLLKDTVFWVVFVEFPIFVKTIEKAKDKYFFINLIKENITLIIIIDFILEFWTFSLFIEIIIVPVAIIFSIVYVLISRENKNQKIKRFFDNIILIGGIVIILNAFVHLFQAPLELLNVYSIKEFSLPILLLLTNLPIIYGLALYSTYEQVFLHVKGNSSEKNKMKKSIILFAGIYLDKITDVRNNPNQTTMISLTNNDIKTNLKKLENRLTIKVGDNYKKRSNFYIMWHAISLFICTMGIIFCNTQVSFKEIISFNFILDISRIKEITTYICSAGVAFSFCLLIYSNGLKKRKNEDLSQVKKYTLYNFLYLLKRQYMLLNEFPPIDEPKELFLQYITIIYELKSECDKSIALFENLLTSWELNEIKQLQTLTYSIIISIGINESEINQYTPSDFDVYFVKKKFSAPQNEKINVFVSDIENGIKKYSECIKLCFEEFKRYVE